VPYTAKDASADRSVRPEAVVPMTFRPRERLVFSGFDGDGYFNASEVRGALRDACLREGSLRKWARKHRVSPSFVSAVLQGLKVPSAKVLKPLGFDRIVLYTKNTGHKRGVR
jgi:hypothetical protein